MTNNDDKEEWEGNGGRFSDREMGLTAAHDIHAALQRQRCTWDYLSHAFRHAEGHSAEEVVHVLDLVVVFRGGGCGMVVLLMGSVPRIENTAITHASDPWLPISAYRVRPFQ